MKTGSHHFKYRKVHNGLSRYGHVELEIKATDSQSKVTDACSWQVLKESHPNLIETDGLRIWKQSAIEATKYVIDNFPLPEPLEIIVKDVAGVVVDTLPSHLGAAAILGIFDLLENPLCEEDRKIMDEFITENSAFDLVPEYQNLSLPSAKAYAEASAKSQKPKAGNEPKS